ncbi:MULTISPECIES: KH domain-containing protein [Campylobacter]|uniref:KH domain-containing protein n=1 Tax=Campylobacter magnus TaxID=3026462 RepID=A0ABT8T6Q3_9BACT|nr:MULTISPECIES: KH domain-containing protein [Campylobacter]MCI7447994.1 KH domain-containing protein [Campylobacter sp.]MDD0846557.1 KH domain-containing protein [Campylobacter magnus]MDD0848381.1 KH domain-containing protein [Campylobacter magnus]MDO2409292.1 KH domain-containing protein [Campylobacter magnus]MDY2763981.1 KH domain-containing protein [Campylobacter sp.]
MVEKFIEEYAKLIASEPENVSVSRVNLGENFDEIIVRTSKNDTGRLIGKDGKMINALKTLITGYKAKEPTSYRITVKALDE